MPPGPVLDFYLFEKAKAFQQAGNFPQAEACYKQLLERDPKSVKALNNLGIVYEAQKRIAEAEWAYRRALEIDPGSLPARYNLAHALHADGRLDEAEQSYRRVIALDPGSYSALFNLGRLLESQHRLEEAEPCYRRAAEIVPESTAAHSCLGETLYQLGRFEEALAAFRAAAEREPEAGFTAFNVGKTLDALGRLPEAVTSYRRAVELDPGSPAARENLVQALVRLERLDDAVQALAEWLFHEPGHPVATHLLASLSGLEVPDRASDAYVRDAFDRFSADYDATLERLSYRAPRLVGMALAQACRAAADLDVLDAGCGTGLCGPILRPYARRLTGVDLSAGMLARARQRGVYDTLAEEELVAHLRRHPRAFDLIAAADTLIYFGALEPLLEAAAGALRPGGRVVLTLEQLEDGSDAPHRLNPTGRYSHSEPYMRRSLGAAGLQVRLVLRGVLRNEGGNPVVGLIVLAEKPASPA